MRTAFVTNNAARTPETVAAHLRELGVEAQPDDVVTSAQAAATLVLGRVGAGAAVLVVGGEGLRAALIERGLRPVTSADDAVAVVQGFAPDVDWQALAEGTFAVRRGLPWIAANLDSTVPTPRGMAPGNGALVGVIAQTTGRRRSRWPASRSWRCTRSRCGAPGLETRWSWVTGSTPTSREPTARACRACWSSPGSRHRPTWCAPSRRIVRRTSPRTCTPDCSRLTRRSPATRAAGRAVRPRSPPTARCDGTGIDALRAACVAAWSGEVDVDALATAADALFPRRT